MSCIDSKWVDFCKNLEFKKFRKRYTVSLQKRLTRKVHIFIEYFIIEKKIKS
jgi:hypothetical protein